MNSAANRIKSPCETTDKIAALQQWPRWVLVRFIASLAAGRLPSNRGDWAKPRRTSATYTLRSFADWPKNRQKSLQVISSLNGLNGRSIHITAGRRARRDWPEATPRSLCMRKFRRIVGAKVLGDSPFGTLPQWVVLMAVAAKELGRICTVGFGMRTENRVLGIRGKRH